MFFNRVNVIFFICFALMFVAGGNNYPWKVSFASTSIDINMPRDGMSISYVECCGLFYLNLFIILFFTIKCMDTFVHASIWNMINKTFSHLYTSNLSSCIDLLYCKK